MRAWAQGVLASRGTGESRDARTGAEYVLALVQLQSVTRTLNVMARKALRDLVEQLDAVHKDSRYRTVWEIAQDSGNRYEGPFYTEQLAAARAEMQGEA